jgi:hypothetical protein
MARNRSISTRYWAIQVALAYIVAGLVLTSSFPAPAFANAMKVSSEGEEPLQDDTELPEGETFSGESGLPAPARRRLSLLSVPNLFRVPVFLWLLTVLAVSRPGLWWLSRLRIGLGCSGHFLSEGRALRLWFQSQTC